MSFGWGPASEMNKTVQKLRRPKHDTLSKIGDTGGNTYTKLTDKRATPKQLKEIRVRLQKENKQKTIITATIIVLGLISLYLFLLFI